MRSPRVMQVVLSLNPGGTERLVVELAKRLHRDVPTAVCCIDERGAWGEQLEAGGVQVHELKRRPGFQPRLGWQLARLASEHRATVLHCHHYSPFVYGTVARLLRPATGLVFTEHGRLSDAPPSQKRKKVNVLLSRLPDAAFAVSEDLRRHLLAEGFADRRMSVIYNGIEVGALPSATQREHIRQRLGAGDDTFVVGTVARLDPVKDLEGMIAAVAQVRSRQPVMLAIIGDGQERKALEAAAAARGLNSSVRFLGQRDDAREWLAGCDAYANSSISEGVSLTILEGMAAALPVVVTKVGGTAEVVDESCGRLVPPRSPEAFAAALLELSASFSLRQQLGMAGRRRVETRFTIDRMVNEYRDIYTRVC